MTTPAQRSEGRAGAGLGIPPRGGPANLIRTFGKYLLDEEIARGGMSRVFSARLRGVGGFEKRLVVKQILPELASDPRFVSMFVQEAKTLVQMSHPHIAPVFELGVVDGVYFLAMEHVEGATLGAILRDGNLAPGLAAHLGVEICDALHYAHTRFDIVHRDVTPRNVIVDGDGHSRLLDFGIAAPLSDLDAEIFGTPGYLAPEQIAGRVEPASDVFSLGAVLFEALTGRRAFEARTVEETERALASEGPAFAGDDGVDEALRAIVDRAIARDPKARFRSAAELGRALRGWLASAHPEGIAPELGVRAERAERAERGRLSGEPTDDGVVTPRTHEVRTLATSRALDALVDAEPVEAASDDAPASEGTVPIERPSREPEAQSRPPEPAPQAAHEPDRAARAREPRVASLVPYALGAALVAALALGLWPSEEPPRQPTPAITRAPALETPEVPPPETRPNPPPARVEPPVVRTEPAPPPHDVAPAPRASVPLTVNASPWAEVELDGRPVGRTPQRALSVRAGRHTIVLRCPPLGREVRHTFEATPGRPLVLVADLTADPPVVRAR